MGIPKKDMPYHIQSDGNTFSSTSPLVVGVSVNTGENKSGRYAYPCGLCGGVLMGSNTREGARLIQIKWKALQ